jgi:chromosome segregation ATPase
MDPDPDPSPRPPFYLSSDDSSEDINELRNMIQDVDAKLTRKINTLDAKLTRKINILDTKIDTLDTKIDTLDAKINQLTDITDNLLIVGIIVAFISFTCYS